MNTHKSTNETETEAEAVEESGADNTDSTDSTSSLPVGRPDWPGSYVDKLEFSATTFERGFPQELNENERWMGQATWAKAPYAPWGDPDAPVPCNNHERDVTCNKCECDARAKWKTDHHYVTGDEVDLAQLGRPVDNRCYIFSDDDGYLMVDMDDVRCPNTGAVHPVALAFLAWTGPTWIEVSSSGTGLHAVYNGDLPGRLKAPKPVIDTELWGSITPDEDQVVEDVLPVIEMYSTKHVMVATGKTVPSAPLEVRDPDMSAVEAFLIAAGEYTPDDDTGSDASDEQDADVDVGTGNADEIRDAIDNLDARRVAEKTICEEWLDPFGTECRAFRPSWASSSYNGTAVFCTPDGFIDSGRRGGCGGPVVMAAVDMKLMRDMDAEYGCVTGSEWWDAVDHLRGLGFDIPEYEDGREDQNEYVEVLEEYAEPWDDPFDSATECLITSLRARDAGAVSEDADPMHLAEDAILREMLGHDPESPHVGEKQRELARDVFESLTVEKAVEKISGTGGEGR